MKTIEVVKRYVLDLREDELDIIKAALMRYCLDRNTDWELKGRIYSLRDAINAADEGEDVEEEEIATPF